MKTANRRDDLQGVDGNWCVLCVLYFIGTAQQEKERKTGGCSVGFIRPGLRVAMRVVIMFGYDFTCWELLRRGSSNSDAGDCKIRVSTCAWKDG